MDDNRATVAVAASYVLDCEAYRLLIQARTPYRVGYCCELRRDELVILAQSQPDIVLVVADEVDDAVRQVVSMGRETCCRLLTLLTAPDRRQLSAWSRAGVDGILYKADGIADLLAAFEQVLAGGRYVSQRVRRDLSPTEDAHLLLSVRERSILELLAHGHTLPEVALELGVSRETVEKYADLLAIKLGARDHAQLILLAVREQLVAP